MMAVKDHAGYLWEGVSMNVGDTAPEFSLPGTTGPGLDLKTLRGKRRAALYFYPADRTPG
jgi:thioredoxin-dependent peroxiredoxin